MADEDTGSRITNRWGDADRRELDLEETIVYRGREGAAYSHHPQITSLDGRLYATWSNGRKHEDDVGQRMVLAVSGDGGDTWSEPTTVATPEEANRVEDPSRAVVTSMGIRPHDGRLVAYYGVYEYTDAGLDDGTRQPHGKAVAAERGESWHEHTHTEVRVSDDGAETWDDPRTILDRFIPNHPPRSIRSGRLIMPGGLWFPYSDDPAGIDGWTVSGIPGLPEDHVDDPEGITKGNEHRARTTGDDTGYTEGSFYQTDDGVVHVLLRTDENRLAVTESADDGETWSEPVMTGYTDCRSRHQFGRLPDGSYYGLSCPKPESRRTPLVLATSDDGVAFDTHYLLGDETHDGPRIEGHHKGGLYGYPAAHVLDGTMYVIYSRYKEDVAIRRVDLDNLR